MPGRNIEQWCECPWSFIDQVPHRGRNFSDYHHGPYANGKYPLT